MVMRIICAVVLAYVVGRASGESARMALLFLCMAGGPMTLGYLAGREKYKPKKECELTTANRFP
jgi:hypothetical protein